MNVTIVGGWAALIEENCHAKDWKKWEFPPRIKQKRCGQA
jgi:hypothetical protein